MGVRTFIFTTFLLKNPGASSRFFDESWLLGGCRSPTVHPVIHDAISYSFIRLFCSNHLQSFLRVIHPHGLPTLNLHSCNSCYLRPAFGEDVDSRARSALGSARAPLDLVEP